MKIFVTGGAGYIGSHVVRQLSEAGHQVTVIDDLSTGFKEALINGEEFIHGNISDETLLNKILAGKNFEAIFHFAGSILVDESVRDPQKYFQNNTVNTLKLINAAVKNSVPRFIFSSTAATYGLPKNGIATEEDTLNPINPYGLSKLMSENMLKDIAAANSNFKIGVLRYFNVAGADPQARMGQRTPKATHLIKVCCEAAVGKRPLVEIYGSDYATSDGTCIRDYIHVEDLADAHLSALKYLTEKQESVTVNVGYGKGFSVKEVVEKAKQVTGVNFQTKLVGRRAGDPASLIAKNEKIKKLFGWTPKYDRLETIVTHAWNWEQNLYKTHK